MYQREGNTVNRYSIASEWEEDSRHDLTYFHGVQRIVVTEIAELQDNRGGRRYRAGAYRVRVEPNYPGKPRTKTFRGESAWSEAANYAEVVAREIMREDHEDG